MTQSLEVPHAITDLSVSETFYTEYAQRASMVETGVPDFGADFLSFMDGCDPLTLQSAESFNSVNGRGGKRLRGVLAATSMVAYGCEDTELMTDVATLIEAGHGVFLIYDDVYDRSRERRGGKTGHEIMNDALEKRGVLSTNSDLGKFLAINAAMTAEHHMQTRLGQLNVSARNFRRASVIMNRRYAETGKGQSEDMTSHITPGFSSRDALRVALSKTMYTYATPLELGSAVMSAPTRHIKRFARYARHAGLAFQLTDDDIGTYGTAEKLGKPPELDIMEGKRTFLVTRAFELITNREDRETLEQALGDAALSKAHFEACKQIIEASGAREEAKAKVALHVAGAINALDRWPPVWDLQKQFMADLAIFGANRAA